MTTNFTQRDVLKIFGEDQDVGTMELNHMDKALHDDEQVENAVGMQKCTLTLHQTRMRLETSGTLFAIGGSLETKQPCVELHQALRSSHAE